MESILYPKKILLGLQEGRCNLACPKCFTHGNNSPSKNKRKVAVMPYDKFTAIIDEIKKFRPQVTPQTWDEPFLTPNLKKYLRAMKKASLKVSLDTNGLLLNKSNRSMLIDLEIDSVFISLDAFREKTYKRVRGDVDFNQIVQNIISFIQERGDKTFPRIGVSFVRENINKDEENLFIDFWKNRVDVLRINHVYSSSRQTPVRREGERAPCWSLNDSLMIHPTGEAALCCVDTHYENLLGNVFEDGVIATWNGSMFNKMRSIHERGEFEKIEICKKCTIWQNSTPTIKQENDHIICSTLTHTYYNKIDRMDNIMDNRFTNSGQNNV